MSACDFRMLTRENFPSKSGVVATASKSDSMKEQAVERKPISLWDASALERDHASVFTGDGAAVDAVVVGGGFTGLSTALHAAEAGLGVHVLEARHIGYGGSGRNVGLVNAGVWHPPAKVRKALGDTYGPRFLKAFGDGPRLVFDLIEKHRINCEAARNGTIHAAHAPSGYVDLQERHAEWQRMGEPVDLLDRAAVAELVGTHAFHGGLVDHRAGTINPMGYCRGLARAALGAGAEISTGVQALRLLRDGAGWRVETNRGSLRARYVVLATNAYTDELWPGLNRIFTTIHYFQLATAPLGGEAAHILPKRQGLWDTAPVMLSLRRDASNRLVIGSMGSVLGGKDRGISRRWAQKRIQRLFPELKGVEFEDAWHGQIAMTPDHLPRICMLEQGLYAPIGYNGRGITTGTIFGRMMAGLMTGMQAEELPLPMTAMRPAAHARLMSRLLHVAFCANQLVKGL